MPPHAPEERGFTDPLLELLALPMHNLYLAERWILEIHTLRYAQFSKPASAPTELHVRHAGNRPHRGPLDQHVEDQDALGMRELVHTPDCIAFGA